jgi:hypothetical protein
MKPLIDVFFAIPCGIPYENQRELIKVICKNYNIRPIINEDDYLTESLLNQIFEQINKSEYFVADISSKSPNVIFELGYAFRAKHRTKIGILLANVTKCPSDLQDIKRMQYGNYKEFAVKLNNWFAQFFKGSSKIDDSFFIPKPYYETFKDLDSFNNRWEFPLGCDYSLTFNGFRFTNAPLPIISKHLAYLDNYIFEFNCTIESTVVGWIINGTKYSIEDTTIDFCIMFNLNVDGHLHPHIFTRQQKDAKATYYGFDRIKLNHAIDYTKRLNIKTYVNGSYVSILINDYSCFQADFNEEPYATLYNSLPNKTNQIGFRCHPGEVATIYDIKVNQIK